MLADDAFDERLGSLVILHALLWRQDHQGQKRLVRNLAAFFREEDRLNSVAGGKDLSNL